MLNKIKDFIKYNDLIDTNDKVLVALSGGPDSVCLLHILASLKDELNLSIGAAHLNHLLRGDDALGDETYVENLCKELGVHCYIKRVDIDRLSKDKGISHEMAGREERYKFFNFIKQEEGYNKIAIAHNSNDQVETVIMRMMRGTGLEGLCGIRVKREGGIIRPILCLDRNEVESYCDLNNLKPRIDKSNLEKIYSRNRIRLDIIPYMKKNFNEDIVESINRMVMLLQKDNDFIESQVNIKFERYCMCEGDFMVINKNMFYLAEVIVTRCIKKAFIQYSNKHTNFEMKHIYEVIELATMETNKKIDLPNGIIAENVYGDIHLKKRYAKMGKIDNFKEETLFKSDIDGKIIKFNNFDIKFELIKNKNNIEFSKNDLIKYFDYDNIEEKLYVRTRKNGDKMIPLGMNGSKKLKDIFMDMKVLVDKRDLVPIVCFDENIAWLVGYRVSELYKITKKTKNIIKITFIRKG